MIWFRDNTRCSTFCFLAVCWIFASCIATADLLGQVTKIATQETSPEWAVVNETTVDFERHVAPLFGRFGCNSAACHGAFDGKGGMQLSLFGYSAEMDFNNLESRLDSDDPEFSMLLLKPSGGDEHTGGVLFEPDSNAFEIIKNWIAEGSAWTKNSGRVQNLKVEPRQIIFDSTTNKKSQLKVFAEFADGSTEDVTHLAQFSSRDEGIAKVSPEGQVNAQRSGDTNIVVMYRDGYAAVPVIKPFGDKTRNAGSDRPANVSFIDKHVNAKLAQLNLDSSPQSTDEEFLRRLMLDTIGTIPTPTDVLEFCQDVDPNKREAKIDELLDHPLHAALWATRMCDITKCDVDSMGDSRELADRHAQMWHDWFRQRFEDNTPYSEIARNILTASSRDQLPEGNQQDWATWLQAEEALIRNAETSFDSGYANKPTLDLYWRRTSDDGTYPVKEVAELTAAAFVGIRLNCAQCHKHPFDRWTQNDYAAFANIFSNVNFGNSSDLNKAIFAELKSRREASQRGESPEALPRLRAVFVSDLLRQHVSGSEKDAQVKPRAFESHEFDLLSNSREQFADWLIQKNNPYFAATFSNRVWSVYFGRGIVDPVDDFSIANPPSHPELLNELAIHFADSNFNIRELEKLILMSATYQRTSIPTESNANDRKNYSRQYLRPMLAEVALDVIDKTLGSKTDFGSQGRIDSLAIEIGTNKVAGQTGKTLEIFGRGEREAVCDCDRRNEPDLRQHTYLVNNRELQSKIKEGSIRELLSIKDYSELVRQLYLRFYSRYPSTNELALASDHFQNLDREQAFDDLVWALLNSREFLIIH